ncbi:MAG: O-antigen ligase family protein [Solirubrobacterales bacterium]
MTGNLAVLLAAILFVVFRRLERRGRGDVVIVLIVGLLLLETTLYPNQSTVPSGIFHPVLGGLTFRLIDLVVPAAVVARISVRGLSSFGANALLWAAFLAWLVTAGLIGLLNGHSFSQVTFEGKAIAYLSAIYLTATIPAREYLASRAMARLIGASAILATLLLITSNAGVAINLGARPPQGADLVAAAGQTIDPAGSLSADAAATFIALGTIAVAMAFNSPGSRQRARLMIAAAPLLASTTAAGQAAAFLELGVALAVLAGLVVVSKRALQTTPTEIALATMIVVGALLVPLLVSTARSDQAQRPPFEREIVASVSGPEQHQTTEGRLNQWHTARLMIEQRPVLGWGLGTQFQYFDPGFFHFFTIDITQNLILDLLLRLGIIGLVLFLAAIGVTIYRGGRAWFRLVDDRVAALALGAVAGVVGILAKAMTESDFEKYRVAVTLALLIGLVISAASEYEWSELQRARKRAKRGTAAPPALLPQP